MGGFGSSSVLVTAFVNGACPTSAPVLCCCAPPSQGRAATPEGGGGGGRDLLERGGGESRGGGEGSCNTGAISEGGGGASRPKESAGGYFGGTYVFGSPPLVEGWTSCPPVGFGGEEGGCRTLREVGSLLGYWGGGGGMICTALEWDGCPTAHKRCFCPFAVPPTPAPMMLRTTLSQGRDVWKVLTRIGANTRHGTARQVSAGVRQFGSGTWRHTPTQVRQVSAGVRQFGSGTWRHTPTQVRQVSAGVRQFGRGTWRHTPTQVRQVSAGVRQFGRGTWRHTPTQVRQVSAGVRQFGSGTWRHTPTQVRQVSAGVRQFGSGTWRHTPAQVRQVSAGVRQFGSGTWKHTPTQVRQVSAGVIQNCGRCWRQVMVPTTTPDAGQVPQGVRVPHHQVFPGGGAQHVQAVCRLCQGVTAVGSAQWVFLLRRPCGGGPGSVGGGGHKYCASGAGPLLLTPCGRHPTVSGTSDDGGIGHFGCP